MNKLSSSIPEYRIWKEIIYRCCNPENRDYKYYGAKGITVCYSWQKSFDSFIADMGRKPGKGYCVKRIDKNRGYYPDNCLWEDRATTAREIDNLKNTSGYRGVSWCNTKTKWLAKIIHNKKPIHIGYYSSIQEAVKGRNDYIITHKLPHEIQQMPKE